MVEGKIRWSNDRNDERTAMAGENWLENVHGVGGQNESDAGVEIHEKFPFAMGRKFGPRQFHCVAKNAARASDRGFQPHDEQRGRSFEFCRSRRRRLGVVRCRGRGRRKGRRQQFVVDPIAVREVLMIHVGCTRCVTSSTDQMMKTSMYFDLFLLCVKYNDEDDQY